GQAGCVERAAKAGDDAVALGGGRVDRDEIVVVEVNAPCAELCKLVDGGDRIDRRPHELAERIAAAVTDGPEAEGELVRRRRLECVRHVKPPSRPAARRLLCREETDARTSPCQA